MSPFYPCRIRGIGLTRFGTSYAPASHRGQELVRGPRSILNTRVWGETSAIHTCAGGSVGTAEELTRLARSRLSEHTTTHACSKGLSTAWPGGVVRHALDCSPEAWPRSSNNSGRVRVIHGEEMPLALPDVTRQFAARGLEAPCEGSRMQQERILCVRLRLYTLCLGFPGKHRAVACGG